MHTMTPTEITEGTLGENTMATEITTRRITPVEGQTASTTSTPTTNIGTAGRTATIQGRRTRRRRTGITAPVTPRTTRTWRAARSRGCWCQLPDRMESKPAPVVLQHVRVGGVLRGAA